MAGKAKKTAKGRKVDAVDGRAGAAVKTAKSAVPVRRGDDLTVGAAVKTGKSGTAMRRGDELTVGATVRTAKSEENVAKSKVPSVPPIVEEVLGAGTFSVEKFVECFDVLVEAAGGTAHLRQMVVNLAIHGKLLETANSAETAVTLVHSVVRKAVLRELPSGDVPYQVPLGWTWCFLGNLCVDVHYGFTASARPELRKTRLLRITDIQNDRVVWDSVPGCEIEDEKIAQYLLRDGDLLIARTGGTIGKTYLVQKPTVQAVFASYLIRALPVVSTVSAYLKLYAGTSLYWRQLYAGAAGTGQPNVNAATLKALLVPLPPLAEQKRIVARVDQLMALIDELEAKQTRKRELGARFTQASLEALTTAEGPEEFDVAWKRVVENWETVIDRAEKVQAIRTTILRMALRGRLSQVTNHTKLQQLEGSEDVAPWPIPQHWNCKNAEKLCEFITKGTTPASTAMSTGRGEVPFLKVYNLTFGGEVDFTVNPTFVTRDTHGSALARSRVLPADVLMNIVGPPLGKVSIVSGDYPEWNINQAIARFRTKPELEPRFLMMCLLDVADLMSAVAADYRGSAGQDNISLAQCRSLPIPLPPLAEQKRIVAKVAALMTLCDQMEAAFHCSGDRASKLVEAVVQEMVA